MAGFWILLLAAHILSSCDGVLSSNTYYVERLYGEQLSIKLALGAEKLEFTSVDETEKLVLWSRFSQTKKGVVKGKEHDRTFNIQSVTYADQGTYTVLNIWNSKISIYLLKVATKTSSEKCVAGETFKIPLGSLSKNDATLHFLREDFNLTLVDHGLPVGNLHTDYMGRVQVTSNSIEVLNVNISDVGNYTLRDHLNRKLRIISLTLVDHHSRISASPLAAVLLLLGIPPCIYCCCCHRKNICKKDSHSTTTAAPTSTVKFDNSINPPEPPPAYVGPSIPTDPVPAYTPSYPGVGGSIVHPPPNPTLPPQPPYSEYAPPAMPSNSDFGIPSAQPPQYGGVPYNQPAPAGFVPMVCNAPATSVTPLLSLPQLEAQNPAQYTGKDVLDTSDAAIQFNMK
ncbi:uncharacterized protein LOC124399185 [Silurus meridionalis]|nr:uncharacterized protein LOC124399185 [Silurus meridionalis]